tara:strand:- start:21019 stop:22224 length:1206 start_codon:yes stop_codon:yes gene_type:complete
MTQDSQMPVREGVVEAGPRSGHILVCSLNFDARPEGINTGRLVRALLDAGHRVTVVCGREKSRCDFEHPRFTLHAVKIGLRHPQWLWRLIARLRGDIGGHHYLWTRRVAKLDLSEVPDVVYGRAWPPSSLIGADALARRYNKPLWLHFSDPFPPPPQTQEDPLVMPWLRKMVARAAGVTVTNQQAADYQMQFFDAQPAGGARIIGHIAPPERRFGPSLHSDAFVYIGAFSPSRPPDALVAGFAEYRKTAPAARIHCVGTRPNRILPVAEQFGVLEAVRVEPYTDNVSLWQEKASVLLAVDWLAGTPVYLLTKVIEALQVDRPLLLLTQPGSPGEALARQCEDTVVCVTTTEPGAVAEGFRRAAAMANTAGNYDRRRAVMAPFAAQQIAAQCAQTLLNKTGS